jgi:hypothetical protein
MTLNVNIHAGIVAWASGSFTVGQDCSSGGNAYRCITAGSATAAPTGTGSSITVAGGAVFKWLSAIDYTSWQTALAALPSTFTQPINWIPWNHGEVTLTGGTAANLWLSGLTTDAVNFLTIRPAPGESICDNPGPLGYYPARGVALKSVDYAFPILRIGIPFTQVIGMQFKTTNTYSNCIYNDGQSGVILERNIMLTQGNASPLRNSASGYLGGKIRTNVFIMDSANNGEKCISGYGDASDRPPTYVNNTIVRPSNWTAGGAAFDLQNDTNLVRNNLIFGFTVAPAIVTIVADGHNGGNNTTAMTGLGSTGNVTSMPFTTATFVQPSSASALDLRTLSGSGAVDAGVADTTNVPAAIDFFGTARPQGSSWDMGAFELPVAYTARAPYIRFFG